MYSNDKKLKELENTGVTEDNVALTSVNVAVMTEDNCRPLILGSFLK